MDENSRLRRLFQRGNCRSEFIELPIIILLSFTLLFTACGQTNTGKNEDIASPASEQTMSDLGQTVPLPEGDASGTVSPKVSEETVIDTTSPGAPENMVDRGDLPAITNADGMKLQAGMSRTEFETFYGKRVENNWTINYPDEYLSAAIFDDEVVLLSTAGEKQWMLDNGVEIGMSIKRVRELLGKEDYRFPHDPENRVMVHRMVYVYDGGDVAFQYYTDNAYAEPDKIKTIVISSDAYYANEEFVQIGPIVNMDQSGEGEATVEYIYPGGRHINCEIMHDDAMALYLIDDFGTEREFYRSESAGEYLIQDLQKVSPRENSGTLRIETEGAWRVLIILQVSHANENTDPSASGQTVPETSPPEMPPSPDAPANTVRRGTLPAMRNEDGETLRIGMSRDDFEGFYGKPVEDDWNINYPDEYLSAAIFDDEAVLFSTAGKRWWTLDNGVEIGMPIERVRELLGKEDYLSPDDPGNRAHIHRLVYEYDNGNAGFLYFTDSNENSESGVEANKVISITITSDVYYANIGSVYPHPTVNTDDSGK